MTERFNLNFKRDRLFWVLEKLELAALHLAANDASILARVKRALLEMVALQPADLPDDLREQLGPIRHAAMHEISTIEAKEVGQVILRLRVEVDRRTKAR